MRFLPLAVALGIGCAAVFGGPALYDEMTTNTYDLSDDQRDLMHETARSGTMGLQGFERAIKYPNGEPSYRYPEKQADAELAAPPVPLGQAFSSYNSMDDALLESGMIFEEGAQDIGDSDSFTPSADKSGVLVTYMSKFVNLNYDTRNIMVLRNPNKGMFGDDGMVSMEEMLLFYADEQTKLVSLNHKEQERNRIGSKSCVVELTLDGNELDTDAIDNCEWRIDAEDGDELALFDELVRYLD